MVGRLFADRWFETLGVPVEIVSQNATTFTGQWFATMCAARGIVHAKSVATKPQSTGPDERAVQSLINLLRRCGGDDGWPDAYPRILSILRHTPGPSRLIP